MEPSRAELVAWALRKRNPRMTIIKPVCAAVALLAFAACDRPMGGRYSTPGSGTPGAPTAPTAANPTGSAASPATGGGVPTPAARGGAGGVGSGGQPGVGGTGGGGSGR
jgi:hypothetical protein